MVTEPRAALTDSRRALRLRKAAAWLGRAYAAALVAAVIVRFLVGDAFWWSFAVNSFLVYYFFPLPLLLVLAWLAKSRGLFGAGLVFAAIFLALWGGLLVPKIAETSGSPLRVRVMAFNVLGHNYAAEEAVEIIREVGADLVAIQELNPEVAEALEQHLAEMYPHRWIEARRGLNGGGILSRHALSPRREPFLERAPWNGRPMLVDVSFPGRVVTFVRFHAMAPPGYVPERETAARALVELARKQRAPLIAAGDLNATDQSRAHRILTEEFHDCWRKAGFGLGHTFPGEPTIHEGGARLVILGVPVPKWLIRIDYVLHSKHFKTLEASVGPEAQGSDHRPVVATLVLE